MDSGLTIRTRQPLHKSYAPRDPMPVRGVTATDLDSSRTVAAAGDGPGRERQHDSHDRDADERPGELAGHDLLSDPASRELMLREHEASTQAVQPGDAMLHLRAYSQPQPAPARQSPEADIEA
jgi:hypothetical protein